MDRETAPRAVDVDITAADRRLLKELGPLDCLTYVAQVRRVSPRHLGQYVHDAFLVLASVAEVQAAAVRSFDEVRKIWLDWVRRSARDGNPPTRYDVRTIGPMLLAEFDACVILWEYEQHLPQQTWEYVDAILTNGQYAPSNPEGK